MSKIFGTLLSRSSSPAGAIMAMGHRRWLAGVDCISLDQESNDIPSRGYMLAPSLMEYLSPLRKYQVVPLRRVPTCSVVRSVDSDDGGLLWRVIITRSQLSDAVGSGPCYVHVPKLGKTWGCDWGNDEIVQILSLGSEVASCL